MEKIYLARHGQDEDNKNGILNGHRDTPLTELGIAQAKQIAEKIKDAQIVFDVVLVSPLQRAQQTAEIISEGSGQPKPEVVPELIERNFGIMTGKPVSQIKELCAPAIIETKTITYFLHPKGAETFPNLLGRAKRVLESLRNMKKDNALLVTHGDFGKMVYAAFYDLPWESVLTDFHFGNSELLLLSADSDSSDTHVFSIEQHNH